MPGTVSEFPGIGVPTEADARVERESVQQLVRILETGGDETRFRFPPEGNNTGDRIVTPHRRASEIAEDPDMCLGLASITCPGPW